MSAWTSSLRGQSLRELIPVPLPVRSPPSLGGGPSSGFWVSYCGSPQPTACSTPGPTLAPFCLIAVEIA